MKLKKKKHEYHVDWINKGTVKKKIGWNKFWNFFFKKIFFNINFLFSTDWQQFKIKKKNNMAAGTRIFVSYFILLTITISTIYSESIGKWNLIFLKIFLVPRGAIALEDHQLFI